MTDSNLSNSLGRGRKRKILVADDSITIQKLVNLTLAGTEFEIITALDGHDAKNKIKRMKPEIVLLDAKLREVSGIKICTEMKRDKEQKSIRVFLLKGSLTKEEHDTLSKAGADGYLDKPFDSKALWGVLQGLTPRLEDSGVSKSSDYEDTTSKSQAPRSGPFSSYRETDKQVSDKQTTADPHTRLQSVPAEFLSSAGSLVPEPSAPIAEDTEEQAVKISLVEEPPPEFNTGEVTNRISYDSLAREEIRSWIEKNLPPLAERLLKDEISRLFQKK